MSSTPGELRHVMLGSIFKPEIPLGPTRDILISCHASATGKGKLHGSPECRTLRSAASVNQIDIPFGEAVERLCANCRWPLPTDSPILPLGAAVSEVDSLTIWLDRDPEDEEDIEAERDAAIALSTGDYPPHTNDVGDAEEEDDETGHDEEWERYDRARNFRSGRHSHWRRLHSYLARSNEAVAEYPFLAPWAGGLQSRVTAVLDAERRAFAALVQPAHLVEAAAVRVLPTPRFSGDPGFAGLGAEAEKTFRRAWYEWSHRATWSWQRLEDQDFSVYTVVSDAFGRRRKGEPEAHAAFRQLTAVWIRQAREEAGRPATAPWQLVAVKAPALPRTRHSEPERDPLTLREASVIATYQVAFNRKASTTALLVPHLVAEQLLACTSDDMPVQRLAPDGSALPAEGLLEQWDHEGPHRS
ncbi:hypothetical protein J0X20_27795 [Streptomyces sp. KCTC 0041BP]|uniref:hypothetical protein n=1 Tax=Streptomyces sp. KCTC 0041BP TaxID=201500 RepID=UPI001AE9BBAD|nr:hypothetical protein [Streptomyces sp. KCTC 0041BP]MBP0937394.1 hypothetical protein [Streptomyces sp. KCTC 0041BP]